MTNMKMKKALSGVKRPPESDAPRPIPMPDPKLLTRALPTAATQINNVGIAELGRVASMILDYTYLSEKMPSPDETLTQLLIRLGIEVLDTKQVEDYMERRKQAVSGLAEKLYDDDPDDEDEDRDNTHVAWYSNKIRQYRHPIPERVLTLAIYIKKENSNVDFHIHSLNRSDPDPFLSVTLGVEKYYLEVWEEPKFTGVLTKLDAERAGLNNKPTE